MIGFHASHEQHPPSGLLAEARQAEAAGFAAVSSSDHFSPWSARQGESGFSWSWLGAAMQATRVPFGVVNAPGQRYHPAIIAQAIATLGEMFPGRLWVAMGSGEASNEHVTGDRWPDKPARNARMLECVDVVRALLRGEEVSHDGHVRIDRARLWTLPRQAPPIVGAALSVETARWCGGWADGLITVNQQEDRLRAVVDAYREGGGEGKPVRVQVKVAWAATDDAALADAFDQWRTNVFDSVLMADLERVEQFEVARGARMSIRTTSDQWWNNGVFYCLDVETFLDGDGDGIGDLGGLIERVDYLAGIGITALWLMPFYPSPDRDDGYDIVDYYGVDDRLGTLGQFVELVRTARDRGMRVVVDLVVNHTSDQHPWFQAARSDPASPFRDWYVWADQPDDQRLDVVFPGQQQGVWAFDRKAKQYYLHRFYRHQPTSTSPTPRSARRSPGSSGSGSRSA